MQPTRAPSSRWILGCLALWSCDLYTTFSKNNENNCTLNPSLCSIDQMCSEETAQCEPRLPPIDTPEDMAPAIDLMPPPPPPVGFMFTAGTPLSLTAMRISGLAAADLNRDTFPEIVYTDSMANTVVIVRNQSGATFDSGTSKAVGLVPAAPRIADFNLDGFLDVANVNSGGNSVTVQYGDGNANLLTKVDVDIGTAPADLTVADVIGDGKPALLTANPNAGTFSVIRNAASLSLYGSYLGGSMPSTIATGQFDQSAGSGPDVVVANRGASQATVYNNGLLLYSILNQYGVTCSATPFATVAADFNRDGQTDLATVVPSLSQVRVCLTNGNSGCKSVAILTTQVSPAYAVATDLNGDGKVDLAVANRTSKNVSIYLNNDGNFSAPLIVSTGNVVPYFITAGDFNQDLKNDLVVAESGTAILVLRNTSN